MRFNKQSLTYAVLAALGLLVTAYFNTSYVVHGGNLLDPIEFLRHGWLSPAARSITSDLLIAYAAFAVFAVLESRRIGMRYGWLYPLIALVTAFAFMFPLFLLMRERHLRQHGARS
jgi:hypothetical protein